MSFSTVLRDDFKNTRRSNIVLAVIGILTAFVALIVYSVADFHPDAFRALFDVSFFFFLVFPLILIPLTYLSVAGDRERGSIKHALGLPNTRAEYVFGKFTSRAGVAIAAVFVSTTVAFLLGLALYENAIDPLRFVKFALITTLFVASLTAIFVACSTITASRSRAMFGVITAYFLLGPFWFGFLPIVNLTAVIETVADTLGASLSDTTLNYIRFSSPTTAYLAGLEPVYSGVIDPETYPRIAQNYAGDGDELYAKPWFNYLVMTAWGAIALGLSYLRFRVAELG
jgi:ABC-2 type transport system permease protein